MSEAVDVLAIGAHPDDVEINCGGALLSLRAAGRTTAVVDLTRGEMGSRGDAETRARESRLAADILGLASRETLGLPDGDIPVESESRLLLIRCIRRLRPRLVITHSAFGHPDHFQAARLVSEAVHHAGLARLDTGQERWRPRRIAQWISFDQSALPHFAIDISPWYEEKERAIRAYKSQLGENESGDPETYLSQPEYLRRLRRFHGYLGNLAGCRYAEGFLFSHLPLITDPTDC